MLSLFAITWLAAQIEVYSEFRRIGPNGEIVAPDQGGTVREMLSPAVARGGHASFHLVIKAPAGSGYTLYVGQNPEGHGHLTLYRELYTDGLPDRLQLVKTGFAGPHTAVMPDNQTADVYWMDIEYPPTVAVERVKVEPQLWAGSHWIVYPMEIRLTEARLKSLPADRDPGVALNARVESAALLALREKLCGTVPAKPTPGEPTVRRLVYRNARELLSLPTTVLPEPAAFCKGEPALPIEGFVRLRNQILQGKPQSSQSKPWAQQNEVK